MAISSHSRHLDPQCALVSTPDQSADQTRSEERELPLSGGADKADPERPGIAQRPGTMTFSLSDIALVLVLVISAAGYFYVLVYAIAGACGQHWVQLSCAGSFDAWRTSHFVDPFAVAALFSPCAAVLNRFRMIPRVFATASLYAGGSVLIAGEETSSLTPALWIGALTFGAWAILSAVAFPGGQRLVRRLLLSAIVHDTTTTSVATRSAATFLIVLAMIVVAVVVSLLVFGVWLGLYLFGPPDVWTFVAVPGLFVVVSAIANSVRGRPRVRTP
jgi:hypothetical protein